jgi:hypothetical protein
MTCKPNEAPSGSGTSVPTPQLSGRTAISPTPRPPRTAKAICAAAPSLAIGRGLLAGFGLGLVVFLLLSGLSYKSVRHLAGTLDWVGHTHEVLAQLQKVNSDLSG